MRRKPPKWSANWGISLIVFFSTVIIDVNANDVFSSYQDYIKQLAYPARLVVRPDASVVVTSSPVSFFCRSDGNPLPTVVWKVNGKSITDSRFTVKSLQSGLSTLRIEPVIPSDNQSLISCSADNGVASPVFAEALLTVFEKESTPTGFPSIDSHPSLKSVEQGRTAHVNCRVHGAPRPKVLWLRDLIPVDIRADARYSVSTIGNPGALMIQNAREEDQGKYECVARNEHGVMHSKSAHLYVKVRRVPPYFSYKLEKLYKVHIGGNLNLTCVAVGYPMPRVFWKKSGDVALSDPLTAPIGKNILTLSAVEKSENFTCVAVSKLGNIEAITTVMAKPSPPSPSLLRVDGVTSSSVTLAWDHVKLPENERLIKYLIKFRQKKRRVQTQANDEYGDSSHFRVKEISAELQRATIGDLEPFTLYEFTISTVNEIGSGNPSSPREAQTAEAAPSTPPRKVQARAMNRGSIYVTWEPSEHPNGEISGYRILYTDGDKNTPTAHWESKDVTGQPPSQIHGLKLDAIYHIYVQARNRKGVSPLSNLATVITTQGIPGQPQSLTAKASDSRGIQLTWEQPLLVQPILRYVVWMNGTEGERELTLTNAQEKYSVTGLDPNIYYAFRVAAESQRGRGPFCPTVVAQTLPSAPAGPPTITAMSSENSSSIEISWSPPDQIHQNGKIVNYQLKWRSIETIKREKNDEESEESNEIEKKNEEKWEVMRVDGMSGKSTVIGLIPATVYEVTIAAGTEKGFGPESHRRTIRTKEDFEGETVSPVPSAPLNLRVELADGNTVRLNWDPPLSPNGQIKGYYVYKEKLLNGAPVPDKLHKVAAIQDAQKTEFVVERLDPNTEYVFRVNAFNRHGDGEFSESQPIVTGGIPPPPPQIVSVSVEPKDPDGFPVKAKISWAPHDQKSPHESPIDRYILWYRPEGKDFRKIVVNGTQTEAWLNGLWLGRTYEIIICAENEEGSSFNITERLVTPVGVPDAEPSGVHYEVVDGKMRISWEPPAEERRNGEITSYRAILTPMHSDGQPIEKTVAGSDKAAVFSVEPRKSYTFKVAAATMKGYGPYSPVLTINPDPAAHGVQLLTHLQKKSAEEFEFNVPEGARLLESTKYKSSWLTFNRKNRVQCARRSRSPENRKKEEKAGKWMDEDKWMTDERRNNELNVKEEEENDEEEISVGIHAYLQPQLDVKKTPKTPKKMPPSNVFGAVVKGLLQTDIALVGPPTNVRVQATSNSSAVIEWDFDGEQVDGFVVKYIHEPRGTKDTERWTARTVMSPSARHLEIGQLTAHKPYAFCVLAIRQNRQGSCSDPPSTISQLTPLYMVRNLHVKWKTSNSVMLAWEYDSPGRITGFYLNHTGKKEYMDQQLAVKTMFTPGFKKDADSGTREYLWINLRPFMRYTFTVGVLGEQNKQFWPKEVIVLTDPTGPPLVNAPRIDNPPEWVKPGQLSITPTPASEEYGPISHYWIVVIPGNVSYEHVVNMEPRDMELATTEKRAQLARMISAQPTKKVKKSVRFSDDVLTHEYPSYPRKQRALSSHTDGVYVTAKIGAEAMRSLHSAGGKFIIGDERVYDGFTNYPMEPGQKYRLMTRAFAAEQKTNKWEHRPPMSEKTLKLYTDSSPTEMFMSSSALTKNKAATGMWFIGPAVALFVIAIIVFMLVCWWLRCSRKRLPHTHRHGSITKVALGGPINGLPSETSKLLPNESYSQSQRIMNPYDQLNGQMESAMDDYGMTMQSHTNGTIRKGEHAYAPLPIHTSLLPNLVANTISHPPIPISQLAQHIERLRGNNNLGFQQEFESIETGQHFTWEHSNSEYNKHKNRYANVVAYDHSRVMLCPLDGIPGSDYINANYIDGYEKPKAYIATQGPLPETFDAFWRMVWEEGTAMIVMLTNLEERSRVKCDQYWPSRGTVTYGDIQVTLLETTIFAHYTSRTFRIQALGEPLMREVRQLQYTAWPDHGVPDHPTPFLVFLKRVRTLNPADAGPILSHCSAGIGRTGAFIVIDIMLERLRYENTVDIYGCVTNLRAQRSYMVQTEDQYIFIHDAVLDAVNSGSTEVPANRLYQHVQALSHTQNLEVGSGIDIEFRHLSTMKTTTARCSVASLGCNRHKNRQLAPVPFDNNRMILQMFPGVEGSDYINASWIDGYRERNAYIGTQGPIQATVEDFWRMIWESEAAIIVMLCKTIECNREWSFEYWPQDQGVQIGGVIVEPVAEYNMPQYILREFRISDPQSTVSRTVRHFQYMEWPEQGVPRTADTFLDFIQQVHRTKAQFGVVGPVVVHCGGGAIRSGVFISLALLIDRIHEEHVVDVFTTVKLLRTERSNMVGDKEHYHFLYQAVVEYLSSYDQSAFS